MKWTLARATVGGIIVGLGIASALALVGPGAAPADDLPSVAHIDLPTDVAAGGTVIGWITPVGTSRVQLVTARGMHDVDVQVEGNRVWFEIGPPITDRVGLISVLVPTDQGPVHASTTVRPAAPTSIDPLAGPRTIIADGSDETMVVTIPTDELGNRLPDGTPVTVDVIAPDGGLRHLTATTEGGLAAVRFSSTTTAGPVTITAASGAAVGPAVRIDQVAGPPERFALSIAQAQLAAPLLADGRSLHRIVTEELRDSHGNLLPDGIGVDVAYDGPDGPGHLVAFIAGGKAEFRLQAPARPGSLAVEASIDDTISRTLMLDFESAIGRIPADFIVREHEVVVTIGPVLDRSSAFVPDGTVATIGTTNARIQNGRAVLTLDPAAAGQQLTLTVLGTSTTLEVPAWN